MTAQKRHSFLTLFLIFVLCVNLLNVQTVRADGETPTEPPAPTQVETEPPTQEPTEPPVEVATEAPTEVPVEETPTPVDAVPTLVEPTQVPVETEETPTPIAEILTQVPESTEVVVIDEEGAAVPLATEEAAEIVIGFDPMWCPAGVLPGGPGCTTNFSSISALITNMINNTATYTQNGVIYFVETTGAQTTGASFSLTNSSLGGTDFGTLSTFNLTLQGGWNGQNGASATFAGTTNFGTNSVSIGTSGNPWAGNISMNNLSFNGVSSTNAVTVYTTTGNISLSNIDVAKQAGGNYAAFLSSASGNITIENGSSFNGNSAGGNQSEGVSATTGTGSITISNTSFTESVQNGSATNNGATLSAGSVTLTNVTATGNDGNGIEINNANLVTLNNVTASNNGTELGTPGINGNNGSGVLVNGNAGSSVIINGGTFTNNQEYGVEVGSPANTTIYIQATPTCTNNDSNAAGLGCYNDTTVTDTTGPVITPAVSGTAGSNGWYRSNVSVSWAVSDPESGVKTQSGCSVSNLTAETSGVTLTCSATNNANLSNSASVTIKIDKSNPGIIFSGRTAPNPNGWNNTNVTVNWTCSDAFSGPVSDTVNQIITAEGAGQSATGTCTDLAGNAASDTQGGINIDKTAPSLSLPSGVTTEATSSAGATVTYSASVSDNLDANVTLSCAPASGSNFPIGSTTVSCSSTDQADNAATGSFVVQVGDTAGPVIASHPDVTAEATSASGAAVSFTNPTATDAVDGPVPVTCAPASGGNFPLGDSTITCNASDLQGHTSTSTFVVHVVDTTAPSIAAHGDVTAEAETNAGVFVSYSLPTATDIVDGTVAATCAPAPNTLFDLGDTTVTCQATDQHQNTATSTFVVHVVDTTAPVIAFHADITAEATGPSGAMVNYSTPSATDTVDGTVAVSCAPASGTLFSLGDTTVTCQATDQHQNTATSTFVVHVVDTTAPVIASASDVTVEATGPNGAQASYSTPSATDAVDGPVAVTCSPASGTIFAVGNTTVTCHAMDSHNNMATPETFVVHVVDATAPTLLLPATIATNATSASGAAVTFSATATDMVDQNVEVTCAPSSGSMFPIGANLVTCTAVDDFGNTTQGSFFVNVMDPGGPILSLPGNLTIEATGPSGAKVTFSVTAVDIVDGNVPVQCTPASGSTFGFGTTTVTCTAMDSSEHTNTGSFLVTVQDTTAPAIAAHADITVETNSATGAIVTYTSPSTTDAVDGKGTASCTPASGALFPVGDTTVTCTATDAQGNTSTGTFTVHVKNNTPGNTETTPPTPGFTIPVTGGELIDLDCDTVLWAFGIKMSFYNLCDYQTTLHSVEASNLPAQLPEGFSSVMGLDVDILSAGQFIEELPEASGIEMDFPIYEQTADQFAVLFWSEADGKWIEISQPINADQISQTLNVTAEDEFYHLLSESLSNLFHQILTTQKTGIFVLVKK